MSLSYRNQSIDLLWKSSDWFFIWLGQWSLNTEICSKLVVKCVICSALRTMVSKALIHKRKKNISEINKRSGNEILITVILNFVLCFCITIIINFVLRFCITDSYYQFCTSFLHHNYYQFCTLFLRYFMPFAIILYFVYALFYAICHFMTIRVLKSKTSRNDICDDLRELSLQLY